MRNVYVVVEHFGEWEDAFSSVYCVCESEETAQKKKKESEDSYSTAISREEWDTLCQEVQDYESEHEDQEGFYDWAEGIAYLHPEYDSEELKRAEYIHCESDYVHTTIETAPIYE